jgi:hypothetical protein
LTLRIISALSQSLVSCGKGQHTCYIYMNTITWMYWIAWCKQTTSLATVTTFFYWNVHSLLRMRFLN